MILSLRTYFSGRRAYCGLGSAIGIQAKVQCPLCGSTNSRQLKLVDVEPVIALWREIYQIDIRPEFQNISQMELRECADCSISFFLPECLAGSAQMYAQLEKIEWYYMTRKWEYEIALKDLQGRERILEIGSGSGNFIALAKKEAGLTVEG